jgi:hypothetical protein
MSGRYRYVTFGECDWLDLMVPASARPADAAVFRQDGAYVMAGHREACEEVAREIGGLYCWLSNGRVVVRTDFDFVNAWD